MRKLSFALGLTSQSYNIDSIYKTMNASYFSLEKISNFAQVANACYSIKLSTAVEKPVDNSALSGGRSFNLSLCRASKMLSLQDFGLN
jgi:hypothetical protein